jgi:hypothetical protein
MKYLHEPFEPDGGNNPDGEALITAFGYAVMAAVIVETSKCLLDEFFGGGPTYCVCHDGSTYCTSYTSKSKGCQ